MTTSSKHFILIFFTLLLLQTHTVLSQNNRLENFIKAGPADAETLTKAYLEPYPTGIGGSLNTGWFQSAGTHKLFGIDLQIRGALAVVPASDQRFFVNENTFEKIDLVEGEAAYSPTGAGNSSKGPVVVVRDGGRIVARFSLPQGSGFQYVPAPLIQATVGTIKNTDLILRFIPEIKMGEYVDFNMRGFGIKHSVSQWLPGDRVFPVDISLFAGFNHVDITGHFDMQPDQPDPATNYDNQRVFIDFNTFAAKLVVGKDLNALSFYGGLGYETSTMDLTVTGNYPMPITGPGGTTVTETLTDPFAYSQKGKNKYSAMTGVAFKLSIIRIFGEFTYAKYPIGNAGIGISIR